MLGEHRMMESAPLAESLVAATYSVRSTGASTAGRAGIWGRSRVDFVYSGVPLMDPEYVSVLCFVLEVSV